MLLCDSLFCKLSNCLSISRTAESIFSWFYELEKRVAKPRFWDQWYSDTDIRLLYCLPQKHFAHVVRDKSNLFMCLFLYLQIYFMIILLIQQWLNMNYNHNWHNHLTVEAQWCELFLKEWILLSVLQIHSLSVTLACRLHITRVPWIHMIVLLNWYK